MIIGFITVFSWSLSCGFAENASFESYGIICWSLTPSSLPGELSTDKQDGDDFFSTRKVCAVSHRSNKTTGSSRTLHCSVVVFWTYMYMHLRRGFFVKWYIIYRMADNFRGGANFRYFRGWLGSHENFHPRKLMPTVPVIWVRDDGRGHKHRGMAAKLL